MVPRAVSGTQPPVGGGETQAAAWVRRMFDRIAPRYDLLNRVLSFSIDRRWRRQLLKSIDEQLRRQDAVVLDLCCGTGDVLLEMRDRGRARILGVDFSHPMLSAAKNKLRIKQAESTLVEADALKLPLGERSLDAIAIAFGFRNLANYRSGLEELRRVLKPGGTLAILEFSHPPNAVFRALYGTYSRFVLPVIGGLISGSREAYTYLPESIGKFPGADTLAAMMRDEGFRMVEYKLLTFGIAALHVGTAK